MGDGETDVMEGAPGWLTVNVYWAAAVRLLASVTVPYRKCSKGGRRPGDLAVDAFILRPAGSPV